MNILFGYTKKEFAIVLITLFAVGAVTFLNLQVAFRKSRDQQRKGDIRAINDALIAYQEEFASFPASEQGKIIACFDGVDGEGVPQRRTCEWGWEGLPNIFKADMPLYIRTLPTDPHHNDGARYLYLSNGRTFQLYAALESDKEDEYDPKIVARNLKCGNRICSFGQAFLNTPLDKSIEEYENEMRQQNSNEKTKMETSN